LRDVQAREKVDLVLLDTDLSRKQGELRTQTEYRQAFRSIGVPVCRYRKGASATRLQALDFVRRLAVDGASAIWVAKEHMEDPLDRTLVPWLLQVHEGFASLGSKLQATPTILDASGGPAEMIASILDRPSLAGDLLGYTGQNFFFFGSTTDASAEDRVAVTATQLGYWLHNYILAFPGPILNLVAASAYVNLTPESFRTAEVQKLVEPAVYRGPFEQLGPYYWREAMGELLDRHGGDLTSADEMKGVKVTRVDDKAPGVAFYCVLSRTAIPASEAAVNPDWIPPGAQMTRIRESDLDELGPMLKT
jgi:hypothetical protein